MRHLIAIVLAVLISWVTACGERGTPETEPDQPSAGPQLRRAQLPAAKAETTVVHVDTTVGPWFDADTTADSVRYFKGKVRTVTKSLKVVLSDVSTDTTWVEPLHPVFGIPFGAWGSTALVAAMGPVYNLAVLGGIEPYKQLAAIQAKGGKAILNLATRKSWAVVNGDTVLSIAAVRAFLNTWPTKAAMDPYFQDSTIIAVIVSDDIADKVINGPQAPYRAKIDSLALLWKQRYGDDKLTCVRGTPGQMLGPSQGARTSTSTLYKYRWLECSWSQYRTVRGEVNAYRKLHVAQADTAGLCVTFGINAAKNGANLEMMTPTQALTSSRALLPYSFAFAFWDYRDAVQTKLGSTFAQLRAMADTLSPVPCER